MKLKLGTKILWLQAFSVIIFMASNFIVSTWITGYFGLSLIEANPLWFLSLTPYLLWASSLLLIGAIWEVIPRTEEEKEGGGA